MSRENKENNPDATESKEDSVLKDLEALEQLIQKKEVPEEELVNEIADMAEGNNALAQKIKSSPIKIRGEGFRAMVSEEEKANSHFVNQKEGEIKSLEEKVSNAEKKISDLMEVDKTEGMARLEEVKKGIEERKKSLKEARLEKMNSLAELEKTIASHNFEQEEISSRYVDYAVDNVIEAHKIFEGKEFNLDKGALKEKVKTELKGREDLKRTLDYIENKNSDLERYENYIQEVKTDFGEIKSDIENQIQKKVIDVLNDENFKKELAEKRRAYLKETGKRLFKNKSLIGDSEDYFKNEKGKMLKILLDFEERLKEFHGKIIASKDKGSEDLAFDRLYLNTLRGMADRNNNRDKDGTIADFNRRIDLLEERSKMFPGEVKKYRDDFSEIRQALNKRIESEFKLA